MRGASDFGPFAWGASGRLPDLVDCAALKLLNARTALNNSTYLLIRTVRPKKRMRSSPKKSTSFRLTKTRFVTRRYATITRIVQEFCRAMLGQAHQVIGTN